MSLLSFLINLMCPRGIKVFFFFLIVLTPNFWMVVYLQPFNTIYELIWPAISWSVASHMKRRWVRSNRGRVVFAEISSDGTIPLLLVLNASWWVCFNSFFPEKSKGHLSLHNAACLYHTAATTWEITVLETTKDNFVIS